MLPLLEVLSPNEGRAVVRHAYRPCWEGHGTVVGVPWNAESCLLQWPLKKRTHGWQLHHHTTFVLPKRFQVVVAWCDNNSTDEERENEKHFDFDQLQNETEVYSKSWMPANRTQISSFNTVRTCLTMYLSLHPCTITSRVHFCPASSVLEIIKHINTV